MAKQLTQKEMKIIQLKYFCCTCKYMSLTRAAEELFVSTPAISTAIKSLEDEFSLQLLIRSNNKIELTEAGAIFYERALKLINYTDAFVRDMKQISRMSNTITLGVPPRLANYIIPLLDDAADKTYAFDPNMNLTVKEMAVNDLVTSMEIGVIDAFFGTERPSAFRSLSRIEFCRLPLYVVCSETYPLANLKRCNMDDLISYPFIGCVGQGRASSTAAVYFEKHGQELKYAASYSQFSTLEQMLIRNKGYTLADETMSLSYDSLIQIPLEDTIYNIINIYYSDRTNLNKSIMDYLTFLPSIQK
ncbi:MAG: LysR family transcriptional regulator [Firmicutes bacterium]|nr:LysR family transcriptional regulator [Bacillota bacterium]